MIAATDLAKGLYEEPTVALVAGNLGNHLFEYFAASTLIRQLGVGRVTNVNFPDWGMTVPRADPERYRRLMVIDKIDDFDIDFIKQEARRDPSLYIVNRNHLQRQSFYQSKDIYAAQFPLIAADRLICGADQLLINIRTGDILDGHAPWYPLMPIDFYRYIVAQTRLSPVFMGQLQPCAYVDALRAAFPGAVFVDSRGPIADFDSIRSAVHVLPAISTFSLAAAWLSDARTVFLPLNGFLNPAHMRDIDLIPVDDPRYRFFLFPMNYALPEAEALRHHAKLRGAWKEISRSRVAILQRQAPLVAPSLAKASGMSIAGFDERYYVHAHLDVACDISDGWYANGLHHFIDFGRSHAYQPRPFATAESSYPNLALNAQASQSSISPWSKGRSVQEDAIGAVNGDRMKDYGFHTEWEESPWWIVDCATPFILQEIRVYNRKGPRVLQEQASPLRVEASADGNTWSVVVETESGSVFGANGDDLIPLIGRPDQKLVARYVKVGIPGRAACLHLAEVEVYGIPL